MFLARHYAWPCTWHRMLSYNQLNFSTQNQRMLGLCNSWKLKSLKTLLLHPEVRLLSKNLSFEKLVILWKQAINFLRFKSQMIDCKFQKQAGKAREILEKLENTEIKSKIYLLP